MPTFQNTFDAVDKDLADLLADPLAAVRRLAALRATTLAALRAAGASRRVAMVNVS